MSDECAFCSQPIRNGHGFTTVIISGELRRTHHGCFSEALVSAVEQERDTLRQELRDARRALVIADANAMIPPPLEDMAANRQWWEDREFRVAQVALARAEQAKEEE